MQPLVNLGLQKITETVGIDFNAKETFNNFVYVTIKLEYFEYLQKKKKG